MSNRLLQGLVIVGVVALLTTAVPQVRSAESTIELTVVNIETPQGVKIWEPPSLVVHKGDKVKVKLINMLELEHGYRIAAYGIETVVQGEKTETIEFTADKPGIFVIDCQLHPAHVPGQLVVLP